MVNRALLVVFLSLLVLAAARADDPALVKAYGGQARLNGLSGVHYQLKLIDYASGTATLTEQWLDFKGRRLYRRDETPEGVRVQVSDGRTGWIRDNNGLRQLNADEAKALMGSLHYNFLYLLPRARVDALADTAHYQVSADFIEPFSVTTDGDGRIVRGVFRNNVTTEESEYRMVAGIPWPFRYDSYRNGLKQRTGVFLSFELNPDFSALDFSPPGKPEASR